MKKISEILVVITGMVCTVLFNACNHHDEPEREVYLPIVYQFNQKSVLIDLDDISENDPELWKQLKGLHMHTFVVNRLDEFPSCDLIDEEWVDMNPDFSDKTVIINYEMCSYPVIGHRYAWLYDRIDKSYSFCVATLVDGDRLLDDHKACLVRNAIIVNKIPSAAHVTSTFSSPSH